MSRRHSKSKNDTDSEVSSKEEKSSSRHRHSKHRSKKDKSKVEVKTINSERPPFAVISAFGQKFLYAIDSDKIINLHHLAMAAVEDNSIVLTFNTNSKFDKIVIAYENKDVVRQAFKILAIAIHRDGQDD